MTVGRFPTTRLLRGRGRSDARRKSGLIVGNGA